MIEQVKEVLDRELDHHFGVLKNTGTTVEEKKQAMMEISRACCIQSTKGLDVSLGGTNGGTK